MNRNTTGNVVIVGLAVIGLIVIAPALLKLTFGLTGLIITLALWMLSGALAGRMLRGQGYGPIGDIGLGLVGGVVGTMLFNLVGLGSILSIPLAGPIFVGAIGAVVFVYLVRLFNSSFAR